jgi:hypothetical protein
MPRQEMKAQAYYALRPSGSDCRQRAGTASGSNSEPALWHRPCQPPDLQSAAQGHNRPPRFRVVVVMVGPRPDVSCTASETETANRVQIQTASAARAVAYHPLHDMDPAYQDICQ